MKLNFTIKKKGDSEQISNEIPEKIEEPKELTSSRKQPRNGDSRRKVGQSKATTGRHASQLKRIYPQTPNVAEGVEKIDVNSSKRNHVKMSMDEMLS